MSERYDSASAYHYAAYRPALHEVILGRLLQRDERFVNGLDVGCGTGYSTVALAQYCQHVVGIDPSQAMLSGARPHPHITYLPGTADSLNPFPGSPFGVVSFAGSLMYAKSPGLRSALQHLCRPESALLIYDFQILVDPVLASLGCKPPAESACYQYEINVSDWLEFQPVLRGRQRLNLEVTPAQLAHVLLSDSHRYDVLSQHFGVSSPFESVTQKLGMGGERASLEAEIYFSRWRRECRVSAE